MGDLRSFWRGIVLSQRRKDRKGSTFKRVVNAHKKQVLTYLKLTGMRLGYLLNFGEAMMKRGIPRTVNGLPE